MSDKITATITKTTGHPLKQIAKAENGRGVPTASAAIENVLVVSNPTINPASTLEEAKQSGNAITGVVCNSARLEGVSKLWLVVPPDYDGPEKVRTIHIIEEAVPQSSYKSTIRRYPAGIPSSIN